MKFMSIVATLLTLTACFAYLNHRWIRLPPSIGVMTVALLFSLGLLVLQSIGLDLATPLQFLVRQVHFDTTLLHGLLGFLLFAGALSVDLAELRRNGPMVAFLATFGVVFSTILVGVGSYWVLHWIGQSLPLTYCLLFGALISPADPIAVLALLKRMGAARDLKAAVVRKTTLRVIDWAGPDIAVDHAQCGQCQGITPFQPSLVHGRDVCVSRRLCVISRYIRPSPSEPPKPVYTTLQCSRLKYASMRLRCLNSAGNLDIN